MKSITQQLYFALALWNGKDDHIITKGALTMKCKPFLSIIAVVFSLVLGATLVRPLPAYAFDFRADVYIDASGGTPVITVIPSNIESWFCSPVFGCPTVTPIREAAWLLTFPIPGEWANFGGANRGLELTDRVTGELVDSFGVDSVQWSSFTDTTTVFAQLYSVDSSGNISGRTPRAFNASVATAVETGDFQLAMENMQTWIYSVNVYLKGGPHVLPPAQPIGNAGSDQTARVGTLVTLDGGASSDPGGHLPLTYVWSFVSVPEGSTATLSDTSIINPTFTPDVMGNYIIQLVVTNSIGLTSQPDTVAVSTLNSPPVAAAGSDQAITVVGTVVHLDGSHSYDPDGQAITYRWSILSKPDGSTATLMGATTATPNFVADVHGDYSIQLVVTDSRGVPSSPAIVTVSFENVKPVANAGLSQSASVGQMVTLNGSGSTDANGDPLTYKWSVTLAPSGSRAAINDPTAEITSFVPDIPGTFVVQLMVNDGFVDSLPATVQIEAISVQTKVTQDIQSLQQVIAQIAPSAFKNANMQNALLNKLNAVIVSIEASNYSEALEQLQNDILGKTNGCATSVVADKNDWILTCAVQNRVYQPLRNIIAEVKALCGC